MKLPKTEKQKNAILREIAQLEAKKRGELRKPIKNYREINSLTRRIDTLEKKL